MNTRHPNHMDLTGQVFGRLTAIEYVKAGRRSVWRCLCSCGTETLAQSSNLRKGTGSCGCARIGRPREGHSQWRGGISDMPEYGIFMTMKARCTNKASKKYANYGGAGIRCLFTSFEQFLAEIGPRPTPKHTVDRRDTFGDYAPGNVRWATQAEQQKNKRPRRRVFSLTREDFLGLARAPLSFGA